MSSTKLGRILIAGTIVACSSAAFAWLPKPDDFPGDEGRAVEPVSGAGIRNPASDTCPPTRVLFGANAVDDPVGDLPEAPAPPSGHPLLRRASQRTPDFTVFPPTRDWGGESRAERVRNALSQRSDLTFTIVKPRLILNKQRLMLSGAISVPGETESFSRDDPDKNAAVRRIAKGFLQSNGNGIEWSFRAARRTQYAASR
jgi:hypothetical protein